MRIVAGFAALVGVATGIGWLVAGALGAVIASAGVLLAGLGLYANASACVLRLAGAYPMERDAAPDLHRLVERLAAQASLPGAAPRLYWLPGDAPNALATGRDPAHAALALTPALLTLLTRDELAGVLTRELACIARRYTVVGDMATPLAGGLVLLAGWQSRARAAARAADAIRDRGGPHGGLWGRPAWRAVLVLVAARLVRAASSAEHVHAADAEGAQMLGDPFPIARALEKLTAANSMRPERAVNPGLVHQFVVAPYTEEPVRLLFTAPPPLHVRLQRLTRQALRPAAYAG